MALCSAAASSPAVTLEEEAQRTPTPSCSTRRAQNGWSKKNGIITEVTPACNPAAVVPMPHDIKGQGLYAYVTLQAGEAGDVKLIKELRDHVTKEIGPIAKPDVIQFTDALPKTRSGKIMRRILKVLASGGTDVGNTMTLADPSVVDTLMKERDKLMTSKR